MIVTRLILRLRGLKFRERRVEAVPPDVLERLDTAQAVALGMSVVDWIRGTSFQSRSLLMALRAGEPVRVALSMGWEIVMSACIGRRAFRRTDQLIEQSRALADRLGDWHAIGMARLGHGAANFLSSRFRAGVEVSDEATAILRERCPSAVWELDTSQMFAVWSLFFCGEIGELRVRCPRIAKEARERGDMYLETTINQFPRASTLLGDDDPDQARHHSIESLAKWSQQGFHVQHLTSFFGQMLIDLYKGDGEGAWRYVSSIWPEMEASMLLKIQHVYIDALQYMRPGPRQALGPARRTGSRQAPLLKHAERTARIIDRQRLPWADTFATHVRAGIAAVRGDEAAAVDLLRRAIEGFDRGGLALYAASAPTPAGPAHRRRRGPRLDRPLRRMDGRPGHPRPREDGPRLRIGVPGVGSQAGAHLSINLSGEIIPMIAQTRWPGLVLIGLTVVAAAVAAPPIAADDARLAKKPRFVLDDFGDNVWCVTFAPDGKSMVTCSGGRDAKAGEVRGYDLATGKPVRSFRVEESRGVRWAAFAPDGKTLATGEYDGMVKLREPATGKVVAKLEAHPEGVQCLKFTRDGKTLATCGKDQTVKIWDVATRKARATMNGHGGPVYCLDISGDDKTLVTGGNDTAPLLWNVATGEQEGTLPGNQSAVEVVRFSPDGKLLAVGGWDSVVHIWETATDTRIKGLCSTTSAVACTPWLSRPTPSDSWPGPGPVGWGSGRWQPGTRETSSRCTRRASAASRSLRTARCSRRRATMGP